MSSDVLKSFEARFFLGLKQVNFPDLELKASKGKVSIMSQNVKLGQGYVKHLSKADGYYAGVEVYLCDAFEFCQAQNPPYETRLLNKSFLSANSLSEEYKRFGDEIGGIIRLPKPEAIATTVEKILERFTALYLLKAHHAVVSPVELINDVIESPDDYAFPFLTALYVAHKHGFGFDSKLFQEVVSQKRIIGNKKFDIELAKSVLS